MEWVEVTAKTVAEAKDKALDYLGVDEAQAEFEVLEEPRVGLFKRLKGEARVRARIKPTVPRPKAERRDRRRGGRSAPGGRGERSEGGRGEGREGREGRGEGGERPARRSAAAGGGGGRREGGGGGGARREGGRNDQRRRGEPSTDGGQVTPTAADGPVDPAVTAAIAPIEPGERAAMPMRSPHASDPSPARDEPASREEPMSAMSDEDRNDGPADDGRQTEHAVEFLSGLVAAFGVSASVSSTEVDEHYDEVRIEGSDLGLLIGPRAVTLDAVQELTRVVAQRRSGGRGESRLRVDIGGYRQRRREALERFARQLAEEVRTSGKTKALEPMNSADRKVVHDVVGTIDGVSTLSEGEDPRRRVVIVPSS